MGKVNSIPVKDAYICIGLVRRLLAGTAVFIVSLFLFVIFFNFLGTPFFLNYGTFLSFALSIVLFVFVFCSEYIIKRFTRKHDFPFFDRLQTIADITSLYSLLTTLALFAIVLVIGSSSSFYTYSILLVLLSILILVISTPFLDFYSPEGNAILALQYFINDYSEDHVKSDFSQLHDCATCISKKSKEDNIVIQPSLLCLGLSLGCIEDKEATLDDLNKLVKWIENSRDKVNFTNFRHIVNKYNRLAKKANQQGIMEKHPRNFQQKYTILNVLVVPLIIAIITVAVPTLSKIL